MAHNASDATSGFPVRLRAARLKANGGAGLGQQQLAAALGISQATISDYERGRRRPSLPAITRLAKILGVSVGWLVAGETTSSRDPAREDLTPQILATTIGDLLDVSSLTWLGRCSLSASAHPAAPASGARRFPRAAEAGADYAARTASEPTSSRVIDRGLANGAKALALYAGPAIADVITGDVLLINPTAEDAVGWRVYGTAGEGDHVLCPPDIPAPTGLALVGTVQGLIRSLT